jgi:hypothetical protein
MLISFSRTGSAGYSLSLLHINFIFLNAIKND